jgi:type I restriction enzyme R subunit
LLKNEIDRCGIDELKTNRERVAVEVVKLARNRHDELLRAPREGAD